jgi:hypothetical protein
LGWHGGTECQTETLASGGFLVGCFSIKNQSEKKQLTENRLAGLAGGA